MLVVVSKDPLRTSTALARPRWPATGRATRAPNVQDCLHLRDLGRMTVATLPDSLQRDFHRLRADRRRWLSNRGETRCEEAGLFEVVEGCNRYVLRAAKSELADRAQKPDRHQVVRREDGRRPRVDAQEAQCSVVCVLGAKITLHDQSRGGLQR